MRVKKSGKYIFGADFTAAERKAAEIEIRKQFAEWDEKNSMEICSMILYILHTEYGFGKKRLHEFYKTFDREMDALAKRYMMDDNKPFLCTYKLRQAGIDILAWEKEAQVDNTNGES